MESVSLGGDRNPHETRISGEERKIREEKALSFDDRRMKFVEQAKTVFYSKERVMKKLREMSAFQIAKEPQHFNDEKKFMQLAQLSSEILVNELLLEEQEDQAALLSLLAKLDYMQDEQLKA